MLDIGFQFRMGFKEKSLRLHRERCHPSHRITDHGEESLQSVGAVLEHAFAGDEDDFHRLRDAKLLLRKEHRLEAVVRDMKHLHIAKRADRIDLPRQQGGHGVHTDVNQIDRRRIDARGGEHRSPKHRF